MFSMAVSGVKTVKNILVTFVLIGMITAIWRAGGTIPYIVYHSTKICNPHVMVLITFLLCSLISFLTGTAFGTAATMGVSCVTMANSMGIPIFYTGGAVLAGSYFGDRCSPMSTSALLVSSLTDTSLFGNIVDMVKTSLVPFGGIFLTSILTGMISCNQTLTIMLTHQLCGESEKDPRHMASYLENTAVVIAPLVPWSIAATVPLASVGAPIGCVLAGCYLYLLPIWNYAVALYKSKRSVECSY